MLLSDERLISIISSPQYVAGLFDGEGCVQVHRTQSRIVAHINSAYLPTLEVLKWKYGGCLSLSREGTEKWKPLWQWVISGEPALDFLEFIAPFSIEKHEQIRVALRFRECMPGNGSPRTESQKTLVKEIYEKLQELKKVEYVSLDGYIKGTREKPIPTATEDL